MIKPTDSRLKAKDREASKKKPLDPQEMKVNEAPQISSALFFQYNTQLGPPYHILVDTNFVHYSIKNKLDIIKNMMDCLYAKCIPYITDCVMAELEKMGQKYKMALKIVKDPRFERITCMHKGTYADDCIVNRVTQHKCYIVATNDRDLKNRIRKITGKNFDCQIAGKFRINQIPSILILQVFQSCMSRSTDTQSNVCRTLTVPRKTKQSIVWLHFKFLFLLYFIL